jgi:hypothetical protein
MEKKGEEGETQVLRRAVPYYHRRAAAEEDEA